MARTVLDSSAVLAWLQHESGAAIVDPLLPQCAISAVNWSEIAQKAAQSGKDPEETTDLLKALGVEVVPVTEQDAMQAALLWPRMPALSLADRCCLALGLRLSQRVVTADRTWVGVLPDLSVDVIR